MTTTATVDGASPEGVTDPGPSPLQAARAVLDAYLARHPASERPGEDEQSQDGCVVFTGPRRAYVVNGQCLAAVPATADDVVMAIGWVR